MSDNDNNPSNEIQNLTLSSTGTNQTIGITGGNTISLNVADNDNNPTNEIQNLSSGVSGTFRTIAITGGTSTTFNVADNDNDPTNEHQTLSFNSGTNQLSISNGNTVTLNSTGVGGAFENASGVVRNTGTHQTDDFVFGSSQLSQGTLSSEFGRVYF